MSESTFVCLTKGKMKSSDAKASKCHLKIKLVYLSSVILLKWQ